MADYLKGMIFEILVHLRRQRLEALGGRQERGAGEGSGPRPVHEALRDGHPKASSRRAQLHPLLVRQGGEEAQRRSVRTGQHSLPHPRHPGGSSAAAAFNLGSPLSLPLPNFQSLAK